MKRWMTPLLATLVWFSSANAQSTFLKYYQGGGTSKSNLNELSNGNLLAGVGSNSGVAILDPMGNVLHTQSYAIDTFLFLQSVRKYSDNEFAFAGMYRKDTCSLTPALRNNPVIGRMDSLGNTSGVYYYSLNAPMCGFLCRDLQVTSTNGVIAWGQESFFALSVNATGAVQWAKWFSNEGSFRFFKELPSGDFIAGINMDTAGVVVARLDPAGNFIWCNSYIRPRGMVADCLIESDDSFVITGYTDSTASTDPFTPLPPDYHPKLFMMKLNGSGEVLWCKGYDSDPYRWFTRAGGARMARALDGNYVVLGNLGAAGYNIGYRPFLMKTDLNGDTLWTRSAGRLNYVYDIYDLIACADGGYAYTAIGWGLGLGLFKTDSEGLLPCHNRWNQVVVSDLFPTDSSFTLTSVDGATAHPAFVTDTVYYPLEVTDPCFTSIGKPPMRNGGFRVRPNPNAGRFTVEFADPLMAESYYSVYDALGKLLYQRPLPTGATVEEIDLSRFGKGSYVIRITDPQGQRHERVVVE